MDSQTASNIGVAICAIFMYEIFKHGIAYLINTFKSDQAKLIESQKEYITALKTENAMMRELLKQKGLP